MIKIMNGAWGYVPTAETQPVLATTTLHTLTPDSMNYKSLRTVSKCKYLHQLTLPARNVK